MIHASAALQHAFWGLGFSDADAHTYAHARGPVAVESAGRANAPANAGAPMDEAAIRACIERARRGEREAHGELFDAFRDDVRKLCARLVGPIDADDAVSEVYERVQQKLDSYDPAQPFRRWLLGVASNRCIDRLRRRSVEKRIFDAGVNDLDARATSTPTALDGLVQAETQAAVQQALDRLPDRYRVPLVLRYFLDLGYDEIAENLGVGRNQVASLLFRGKQSLRSSLHGYSEGDA